MTFNVPTGRQDGSPTLVVEDDEAVAMLLCHLLEEQGLRVIDARTAEDGWQAVSAESPAWAVIDIRLPGKDGWWLVERIRAQEATRRMAVVMITGFLDATVEERAHKQGCAWLSKPFTVHELVERLRLGKLLADVLPPQSG